MRFELIDRVVEHDAASLSAVKAVSAAEEYLQDHFPGFAVLPGVMMLEAMAQAGRAFVERLDDAGGREGTPLVIEHVRGVKYANMVRPGQTLHVTVTLKQRDARPDGDRYDFTGTGTVDGNTACTGRFTLGPIPD